MVFCWTVTVTVRPWILFMACWAGLVLASTVMVRVRFWVTSAVMASWAAVVLAWTWTWVDRWALVKPCMVDCAALVSAVVVTVA